MWGIKMLKQNNKIVKIICSKTKLKSLGFNTNLVNITFYEEHEIISFEFHNIHNNPNSTANTELFEMGANGCDFDYFEEFADSCIIGFKGSELDNQTVIDKSEEVYHTIIKLMEPKKQQKKSNLASLEKEQKTTLNKAKIGRAHV